MDSCAFANLALNPDLAFIMLDHFFAQDQPQARATFLGRTHCCMITVYTE
jgi:hypothetical protein